jgi:hypothetical protein
MKKVSMYAPNSQQIEGLTFVLKTVSFDEFLRSLERLTAAEMMSKAHKHRLIARARHILGISYNDYVTKYRPRVPHCRKEDWKIFIYNKPVASGGGHI